MTATPLPTCLPIVRGYCSKSTTRSFLTLFHFCERYISHQPTDQIHRSAHTLLASIDRGLRNIQHGNVLKSKREKIVGKRGFTGSHVDNGGGRIGSRSFDQG